MNGIQQNSCTPCIFSDAKSCDRLGGKHEILRIGSQSRNVALAFIRLLPAVRHKRLTDPVPQQLPTQALTAMRRRLMTGRKVRVPSPAFAGRGEMPVWDFRVLPVTAWTFFVIVMVVPILSIVTAVAFAFFIVVVAAISAPIPTVLAVPAFTALVVAFVSQGRGRKGDHGTGQVLA
jgi:hypothetical protein